MFLKRISTLLALAFIAAAVHAQDGPISATNPDAGVDLGGDDGFGTAKRWETPRIRSSRSPKRALRASHLATCMTI